MQQRDAAKNKWKCALTQLFRFLWRSINWFGKQIFPFRFRENVTFNNNHNHNHNSNIVLGIGVHWKPQLLFGFRKVSYNIWIHIPSTHMCNRLRTKQKKSAASVLCKWGTAILLNCQKTHNYKSASAFLSDALAVSVEARVFGHVLYVFVSFFFIPFVTFLFQVLILAFANVARRNCIQESVQKLQLFGNLTWNWIYSGL